MIIRDSSHRYWNETGELRTEVPGVSQILQSTGAKGAWEIRNAEFYKERGNFAHKAIALDSAGVLDEATVDPRILPYLKAWRDFKAQCRVTVLCTERIVWSEEHNSAGTLDSVVLMEGAGGVGSQRVLLDFKTGGKCAWHRLQVAAYWEAEHSSSTSAGVLYLKKTGKWTLDLLDPIQLCESVEKWITLVHQYHNAKVASLWGG